MAEKDSALGGCHTERDAMPKEELVPNYTENEAESGWGARSMEDGAKLWVEGAPGLSRRKEPTLRYLARRRGHARRGAALGEDGHARRKCAKRVPLKRVWRK